MVQAVARRQPSDNPEELQSQLLRELILLREGQSEEPVLFRAYVQHAQVFAWRAVADGHMSAPQEALDCLRAAQPFVTRFMPDLEPRATAAAEIYFVTQSLHLAAAALAERRVEDRIADARSATERAVLQVLADNRPAYMRRGEIHERLDLPDPPTPPRVGQILAELYEDNLLVRIHGRAQGNPSASFYALSPRGIELCRDLGLIPCEDPEVARPSSETESSRVDKTRLHAEGAQAEAYPPLLDQALSTLVDRSVPFEWRSILAGLVGNLESTPEIQARLRYWVDRSSIDDIGDRLVDTILAGWNSNDQPAPQGTRSSATSAMLQVINTAVEAYRIWGKRDQAA